MKEDSLGLNQGLYITSPLDTWVPETRGASARVFFGALRNSQKITKPVAIKIMRSDKEDYALPLFIEEIKILRAVDDLPGIVRMVETGFIKPDNGFVFPDDADTNGGCNALTGKIIRFPAKDIIADSEIEAQASQGWLPYIALGVKNYQQNLLMLCDRHRTPQHRPFDLEYAIEASVQICEILAEAHKRNIVYLDHKILHYYWNNNLSRAYIIDWNVGEMHKNLTETNKNFDIIQFGARALHFIFTGRLALGAVGLGPTTPDDIKNSPHAYRTEWRRFDDKHIPDGIREIIAAVLEGGYSDFSQLQSDISACRKG